MNIRTAIRILMLSPIYFQLSLAQRRVLVHEYCQLFVQTEPRVKPVSNEPLPTRHSRRSFRDLGWCQEVI